MPVPLEMPLDKAFCPWGAGQGKKHLRQIFHAFALGLGPEKGPTWKGARGRLGAPKRAPVVFTGRELPKEALEENRPKEARRRLSKEVSEEGPCENESERLPCREDSSERRPCCNLLLGLIKPTF